LEGAGHGGRGDAKLLGGLGNRQALAAEVESGLDLDFRDLGAWLGDVAALEQAEDAVLVEVVLVATAVA
jgi:hypothetical protein